jgi:hypothetical protein
MHLIKRETFPLAAKEGLRRVQERQTLQDLREADRASGERSRNICSEIRMPRKKNHKRPPEGEQQN